MKEGRFKLWELAERVGARVQGVEEKTVTSVAKLEQAGPDQLTFCNSSRFLKQLRTTRAGAVLLKEGHADQCPTTALIVADPYYAYAELANILHPRPRAAPGVHATAIVADDAVVEEGVSIGPGVIIGNGARIGRNSELGAGVYVGSGAVVGPDCWLAPGVHVADYCTIGARVFLHAGVVIGADGFGFAPGQGSWRKIPQLGIVRIGDDVDIGANSTIDRGALDDTVIERGVKIDNLVHIAHNVRIGVNTIIAGCTVVAGSSIIGSNCVIGGQSAITGHIEICDGVTIMGMTGVTGSIREAGIYSSPIPARPINQWRKNAVRFTQLDDMFRRVSNIERRLDSQTATMLNIPNEPEHAPITDPAARRMASFPVSQ